MSEYNNVWKCKCGCTSKHSHKAHWAFISKYKRKYSSKYKKVNWDKDDLNTESGLVRKLKIIHTRSNNNQEQCVPVKKVKFDEITRQIVLEIEEPKKSKQPEKPEEQQKVKKNIMIIEKDLIELRELIKIY